MLKRRLADLRHVALLVISGHSDQQLPPDFIIWRLKRYERARSTRLYYLEIDLKDMSEPGQSDFIT